MPKDLGWIKLHRSSFNNKLYFAEPFTRWQAWCDLLLIANHAEGMVRVRGIKQTILRGQIGYSTGELKNRWKWGSKNKVLRFLNELLDEHQVVLQKTNITTLISIVNYNKFQIDDTQNGTSNGTINGTHNTPQTERKRNADGTQTFVTPMNINELQASKNEKNDKNDKEEIKRNIPEGVFAPSTPNLIYPIYSDYNGLPDLHFENIFRLVKATKQIEVSKEDVDALWQVFKEQNFTGEKGYSSERDFYRHFTNWTNKQSFRKKSIPRDKSKVAGKIVGIEFIDDFTKIKMSDGSIQDLSTNQQDSAKYNLINPKSITKN